MSNYLVIGNGFDLQHGMKTKYKDFLDFARKFKGNSEDNEIESCSTSNIIKNFKKTKDNCCFFKFFVSIYDEKENWIDFESDTKHFILEFTKLLDDFQIIYSFKNNLKSKNNYDEFFEPRITRYREIILESFSPKLFKKINKRWDLVQEIKIKSSQENLKILNNANIIRKDKIEKFLYDDYKLFSKLFVMYLKDFEIEERYKKISFEEWKYKPFEFITSLNAIQVLSFNYTCTYEDLYVVNKTKYIHGCLRNGDIVLGYDNEDRKVADFSMFAKNLQREMYVKDTFRYSIINEKDTVYFYGHSVDITDRTIIERIIKSEAKLKFLYLRSLGTQQIANNLSIILGDKEYNKRREDGKIVFEEVDDKKLTENTNALKLYCSKLIECSSFIKICQKNIIIDLYKEITKIDVQLSQAKALTKCINRLYEGREPFDTEDESANELQRNNCKEIVDILREYYEKFIDFEWLKCYAVGLMNWCYVQDENSKVEDSKLAIEILKSLYDKNHKLLNQYGQGLVASSNRKGDSWVNETKKQLKYFKTIYIEDKSEKLLIYLLKAVRNYAAQDDVLDIDDCEDIEKYIDDVLFDDVLKSESKEILHIIIDVLDNLKDTKKSLYSRVEEINKETIESFSFEDDRLNLLKNKYNLSYNVENPKISEVKVRKNRRNKLN